MNFESKLRSWESTWIDGPPSDPFDDLWELDLDQLLEQRWAASYTNEYGENDELIAELDRLIKEARDEN